MATHDIFMPALSSTMTEGKIVEWLKQPGDKVGRGESVLVDSFSIENGLLTQTLKQRRDRITARDAALIERLYGR